MTSYVGLDVGLRLTSVCIVDDSGAVQLERSIAFELKEIALVRGDLLGCHHGMHRARRHPRSDGGEHRTPLRLGGQVAGADPMAVRQYRSSLNAARADGMVNPCSTPSRLGKARER